MRVAIVQAETAPDLASGIEKTRAGAKEAARSGAKLIAFAETWLPGYPAWLDSCRDAALWNHAPVKAEYKRVAENSVVVDGESGRALGAIARELGVTLVIGAIERVDMGRGRGTLYNALLTYTPDGALANHHRKLMPTFSERLMWGVGDADGVRSVQTPIGRVGGLVCWEHWMPLPRQALHESGEDVHVASWPTVHEMHQVASRHYAFEGRCFVLAAGSLLKTSALPQGMEVHPKYQGEWALRGGSMIIAPDGKVLAGPVFDREESMTLDVTGHYSRPDCFDFRARRGQRAQAPT